MGLYHLDWNQVIDLLPQGGRDLKAPPRSRNLVENIEYIKFWSFLMSSSKELFLKALHSKLTALKSVPKSLFSTEPDIRP